MVVTIYSKKTYKVIKEGRRGKVLSWVFICSTEWNKKAKERGLIKIINKYNRSKLI